MKKLNFRVKIVSWDEQPEIEGDITEFGTEPFEIVGIKTENGEVIFKPIGYSNLQPISSIPVGTHIRIKRGDMKKNKKSGRKFYEFEIYVPDDFDENQLNADIPF